MASKPKKVRVNFTLDEDLYKKMKFYSDKIGMNWSQAIEQAILPTVVAFDDIFKQIEKSGETNITKIRMLFQKLLFEVTGQAYKTYEEIERDLSPLEEKAIKKRTTKRKAGVKKG